MQTIIDEQLIPSCGVRFTDGMAVGKRRLRKLSNKFTDSSAIILLSSRQSLERKCRAQTTLLQVGFQCDRPTAAIHFALNSTSLGKVKTQCFKGLEYFLVGLYPVLHPKTQQDIFTFEMLSVFG
jgi:hypothetical protein